MDFSSRNEGKWFWFNGKDDTDGGLCLRVVTLSESKRIEKLTTDVKYKPVRGQVVPIPTVDENLKDRLSWDYCIVDWKGVTLDGQPVAPTAENKVKLMQNVQFASYFIDKVAELNEELQSAKAMTEKNSATSSSGSVEPTANDA
jgi:hypothetical protein